MTSKGDKLRELDATLVTTYNEVFTRVEPRTEGLVAVQDIDTEAFVHSFLAGLPNERKWEGEKIINNIAIKEISGKATPYELTLGIPMKDILSGRLVPHIRAATNLAVKARTFNDRRIAEILSTGTTDFLNYDGAPLFSAARPDGQSNYNASRSLDYTNLQAAVADFKSTKSPTGENLYWNPNYIIVPPALEQTAKRLNESELIVVSGSTESNVMVGQFDRVIVIPELADEPANWYLVSSEGADPFMKYVFQDVEYTSLLNPTDPNVFFKDQGIYGSVERSEILPGVWQAFQRNDG